MDLRLDGKRALVTGSTAGIGYAIAEGLAQEGAEVIVNGRRTERVVEAAEQERTFSCLHQCLLSAEADLPEKSLVSAAMKE